MNNFTYSARGLALTKQFEGLRLSAYQDQVGVWTIGYGHTGRGVYEGLTINEAQAQALLVGDVYTSAMAVNRLVTVALTQNQFDALVDFTFNLGSGDLAESTLLKLLNEGDYQGAALEFPKWCFAGKFKSEGLFKRRLTEQALFLEAE